MATKSQERAVLDKIEDMVANLGECSCLGAAFDGIFEQAQINIEFDTHSNYKKMYDEKCEEAREFCKRVAELQKQLTDCGKHINELICHRSKYAKSIESAMLIISAKNAELCERNEELAANFEYGSFDSPESAASAYQEVIDNKKKMNANMQIMKDLSELTK